MPWAITSTRGQDMDELEAFCEQFLTNAPVLGAVPFAGAVNHVENVTSILMYRRDQFQVQMFAVPGGTVIPGRPWSSTVLTP